MNTTTIETWIKEHRRHISTGMAWTALGIRVMSMMSKKQRTAYHALEAAGSLCFAVAATLPRSQEKS